MRELHHRNAGDLPEQELAQDHDASGPALVFPGAGPLVRAEDSRSMYQMHRVFCATSWELERERQAFEDVLGEFNEAEAMKRGVLYVPVSLVNIRDKRPLQYTVDENIHACRHYILALCDNWGPPERNFERDYQLALECRADPSQPMREIAFLLKK